MKSGRNGAKDWPWLRSGYAAWQQGLQQKTGPMVRRADTWNTPLLECGASAANGDEPCCFACTLATGWPKCMGLHTFGKCVHLAAFCGVEANRGAPDEALQPCRPGLDGGRENVFPAKRAILFHWRGGQLFRSAGARSEAQVVIASRVRMTASERTGPMSSQREASILAAAKARTAARP